MADSVVTYIVRKYENHIHLRDIDKMKSKAFSVTKSIAMTLLILVVAFFVGLSTGSKENPLSKITEIIFISDSDFVKKS